jgi:hypothetical protein
MPDDPLDPELEAIMAKAAEDHAKFIAENNEIDRAWANGTLDQWILDKLKQIGGTDGSDSDPADSGPG